ncbi:protein of unknown function DUF4094 [Dillenia turbinata]|uniref:DUF4094 domain-containing protein n=1 Tax=Dillenia turbinata TaxID=194707 RepID=A0AAN8VII1_9MAGN
MSVRTLDKTIANLEMELAAARTAHDSLMNGSPVSEGLKLAELTTKRKYLMVVGINTAFSSRKRRDSIRETWMPHGSSTSGGILDRAIEAEDRKHGDFLRLADNAFGKTEASMKKSMS